ncbi:hypothetical protein ACLIKD_06785 [Azonexus sp. IMCC34842]|uniref:hypothetical protein n=1 Tax=Azonexus sp. IMCC34842 TaxID=3420950 RepID=UPI003D0FC4D7
MDSSTLHFLPVANGGETPITDELHSAICLAHADNAVRSLAGKLAFRLQELTRKAAYAHYVQQAVDAAGLDGEISKIIANLEDEYASLSAELAAWNDSAKVAERRAKERSAQIAPMIRRANNKMIVCENEILRLKMLLNEARRPGGMRPSEKLRAYQSAGLSSEQIEKLGDAGLTPISIEQAEWDIMVIEGELQRLNDFVRDPLHQLSRLQGMELTEADDYNPGRYVPPVMRQFGDAA